VLILGIIVFGMIIGALAQMIMGQSMRNVNWPLAFGAGIGGSFVGGLLISFLAGDGLDLRPSGIIGSLVGALIVTVAVSWWTGRKTVRH
jgi:uncharacterized membrane protein YeaQ/YmgE (transglycosylase-associated protein family)